MTTILVVDDEFLIAEILSFALEDAEFDVLTASNGQKALDMLLSHTITLMITDFMMPVMNGLELAQAMREHPGLRDIPIILTTGAQAHIAQQNQHLFDAIFEKPFDVFKVIDKVKALTAPI
jgi:CheY-like chemotaxis protein